jgi:glycerol-3-phosphate O-acyltransferase
LGDIIALVPDQSALLSYFRNNISHLVVVPSLVASCFLNTRAIDMGQLHRVAMALYPFLRSEFFLPWDEDGFAKEVDDHIAWMLEQDLLTKNEESGWLERPQGGGRKELQLSVMGHMLLQTFERYYITVAILAKNGSGTLTRSELERLCYLTSQRISQLNEFASPEFSDRQLFRQFISLLRENDVLTTNTNEKLEFNEMIQQLSDDARYILSMEIRHGIIRVAPQVLRHQDQE